MNTKHKKHLLNDEKDAKNSMKERKKNTKVK